MAVPQTRLCGHVGFGGFGVQGLKVSGNFGLQLKGYCTRYGLIR